MNFNNILLGIVNNPLTNSPYVDDFSYLSAPTPPGSEERITSEDDIRLTSEGEIRVTSSD